MPAWSADINHTPCKLSAIDLYTPCLKKASQIYSLTAQTLQSFLKLFGTYY